jgi:hypothetical protein
VTPAWFTAICKATPEPLTTVSAQSRLPAVAASYHVAVTRKLPAEVQPDPVLAGKETTPVGPGPAWRLVVVGLPTATGVETAAKLVRLLVTATRANPPVPMVGSAARICASVEVAHAAVERLR